MKHKTVYLNELAIGEAYTWHEVAALLTKKLRRAISARDAQNNGSEGPDGFYIRMNA